MAEASAAEQRSSDMKFDLKTILGVLTAAVWALAGIAGVTWFAVGLAIAPFDERLRAVQDEIAEQAERSDRRFAEQAERSDRRFAEQAERSDLRFAEQAERYDRGFAEQREGFAGQAERLDRGFASIRESVAELRESVAELKGFLDGMMLVGGPRVAQPIWADEHGRRC